MTEINEKTPLACEGSTEPLTTTPVVGTPSPPYPDRFVPEAEELAEGEIRVTILGSGDPFVRPSQASASILIEVGNPERDLFFFDLGSGALKNFDGLRLPVTATTKVFLTHLHADHVGDLPTLIFSLAKAGRRDPVEVWGPASDNDALGTRAYLDQLQAAHAWDMESLSGHPGQSGARASVTEVPYDAQAVAYERNGVTITSFPVIHIQNGAVGYRLDYAGLSVVFSGDTRPCRTLVDAGAGADLLIHETFPSPDVYAEKAGVPPAFAEQIVNGVHTSPAMAGRVFARVGARMSVMWHLAVDHDTVAGAWRDMRTTYDGPVTIAQDLTVFNITADGLVVRQAVVDAVPWPVLGPTQVSGPPMSAPHDPPAWWADALLTD
ncbi:MAG TPA: guanitoxin biosynthesis MBL fold metallo-hydrolase GntH [Nocardioides sp.]|uniref:guanitoxin biosynthesis MBL fold metallo-hydrolase GntH n=1 Tax=Nocardioides sp. TaxID=35761 RepID=UPI002B5EE602|nr:guanitoxin biosynthesis MBL fold metallo-hydrolase GntH [Nocardioides sp.]HQR25832.1 guanitoxin biosynthesis MBL fold metallo-hydrolase GntH [Nocardioides sp.]